MNTTAAALVGLLAEHGELTGAELARRAELQVGDYWPVTRSQVYRELAALADEELVTVGDPGVREARLYGVTPAGVEAMRSWLTAMPVRDLVRMSLLVAVAFGRYLPPGHLAHLLDDAEREHRRTLAHYEQLEPALSGLGPDAAFSRATLLFGIHHERAVLAWLDALPAEIRRH